MQRGLCRKQRALRPKTRPLARIIGLTRGGDSPTASDESRWSDTPPQALIGGAIPTVAVIMCAATSGLFPIFELGLLGLQGHIRDSLKHPGRQWSELYPGQPIYDIPALPVCGAQELIDRLLQHVKPFHAQFHLGQEATELKRL